MAPQKPNTPLVELNANTRVKRTKFSPDYYKKYRESLVGNGPVRSKKAENTEVNMAGVWRKWTRYCREMGKHPESHIKEGTAQDYVTFFRWILDFYPRVKVYSSLHQYFRMFKLLYESYTTSWMDEAVVKTVNSHLRNIFRVEYKLKRTARDKPVMSVDDLFLVLYHHWVYDTAVFADERQRVQLAMLLLIAAYTGQRPCSLLETRRNSKDVLESVDTARQNTEAFEAIGKYEEHLNHRSLDGAAIKDDAFEQLRDDEAHEIECAEEPDCSDGEYVESECDSDSEAEGDEDDLIPDEYRQLSRGILYKHVRILLLSNPDPQERCVLVMEITIVHTKAEDNKPQPKTFIFYESDNLLLCPIAHMLALALHDEAFEAESMHRLENIFDARVSAHKQCLVLRWKTQMEERPILRLATRTRDGMRTSSHLPLKAIVSSRYLKRLGQNTGFEHPLRHYAIRRGAGNAVDDVASAAERDQIMGHANSGVFQFYLNQRVKCDVQAAFLGRPSERGLFKAVGHMSLTIDPSAPTTLDAAQLTDMAKDAKLLKLRQKRNVITAELRAKHGTIRGGMDTKLYAHKKDIDRRLQRAKIRWRDRTLRRARKAHFRDSDTRALEEQFASDFTSREVSLSASSIKYQLGERRMIAEMLARLAVNGTSHSQLSDRISYIHWLTELCGRREKRRAACPASQINHGLEYGDDKKDVVSFPLKCEPKQCIFCLGSDELSYEQRMKQFTRASKMMDHVEKHLERYEAGEKILCPHPMCRSDGTTLEHMNHFRKHTLSVHGIKLRAQAIAE